MLDIITYARDNITIKRAGQPRRKKNKPPQSGRKAETKMANGKLSSGMEWMYDAENGVENGVVLVYGVNAMGEREWLEPVWDTLTEAEQDELAAIGTELNAAKDAGVAWVDEAIIGDGLEDEWRGMDYPAFQQATSNANAPDFPDCGEFADAAVKAAWDALQKALENA